MKTVKTNVLLLLIAVILLVMIACEQETLIVPEETMHEHSPGLRCKTPEIPLEYRHGDRDRCGGERARIVPIVLIPQGSSITDFQRRQIEHGLENVRLWYQQRLTEKDLRWDKIQYLEGAQTAEHYLTDNNVWGEIPGEIEGAFGWNPWAENEDGNRIALVMGRDLLGWAGANGNIDGRGVAIVGLESLIDLPQVASEWWGTQEYWHGTVIHELGHTLTLPHPEPAISSSIMTFHGDYKNKGLSADEITQAEESAAMARKRPQPVAYWAFDQGLYDHEIQPINQLTQRGEVSFEDGLTGYAATFGGAGMLELELDECCDISEEITISAWVNPTSVDNSNTIVGKWYALDSYYLGISNGQFEFSLSFPDSSQWGAIRTVKAPAKVGVWQHVAGVYNGKRMKIFVDGKLVDVLQTDGNLQQSDRPVTIGGHPEWNGFDGAIEKVSIYNKALRKKDLFLY